MSHSTNPITNIVLEADSGPAGVRVVATDGHYAVEWTDFVANDWSEEYSTLGAALARVALLAECAAADWSRMFASGTDEHAAAWQAFVSQQTN